MKSKKFDPKKFQELILHILCSRERRGQFRRNKLEVILYYTDFEAYRLLGEPVTGAEYYKRKQYPAARELSTALRAMREDQSIRVLRDPSRSEAKQLIYARREADLSIFSLEELKIADKAIARLSEMGEELVCMLSRGETGWVAARPGETIPYQTAWISTAPISREAEEYWREVSADRRLEPG